MSPKERALRDMGWKIGGAGMGEPHQGDMNLFRAERMRRMPGGDVAKRRGLYVVRDYFGSGQGTDVNQTIHDGFYRRARVAAIQFKPSLVMTNFQRVLRFKDGAWQVQSGDIGKRDGVPRTVFIEGAHAYFEAKPEFDDMGTRIPKNLYPKYSFFYWPMRLPPSYLVDSAPTSQPPRETGMTVSTLEDSLPPGWRGHTRSNPPAGYREAAGCIVQRGSDKKILLLRRSIHETSFHGMYELPGGKLEEGETPKEAALIETKEEAGLDVRIVQTLQPHIDHDMKKVYHGFVGAPKKGAKVKISEEHDEYKWVSIKQALALPSGKLSHHARFLFHQMLGEPPLPNPLPKPRKKNGRKEPSKKFVDRMMGNTKMRAEFPDAGQRYAVTLRLVEKHYGKAARKKIAPRENPSHYTFERVKPILHLGDKSHFVGPGDVYYGVIKEQYENTRGPMAVGKYASWPVYFARPTGETKIRVYAKDPNANNDYYKIGVMRPSSARSNGLFGFGKKKRFDAKGQDSNGLNFSMVGDTTVSNSGPAYSEYRARTSTTNDFHEVTYAGVHPDWLDVDFGQGPQRYQGPIRRFKVDRIKGQVEVEQGSVPQSQVMSTSERQEKLDALGPKPSAAKDPAGFDRYMRQKMEIKHGSRVNPSDVLPIYSGEPKGMTKNLGAIFSEVVIGRNIVKDVGEAVQSIYRGLIGGRTSMAEKRLAMGVASMQKELSDNARKLGGNAVANVKMDYEVIQGTATISIVATADAIKMRSPPKKNPAPSKKLKRAKDKYKKFHGGKEPVSVKTEKIDVGDVWYALGPCWSIGYMSPKETGDDEQKYIHHTNEDSKDGNFPMMYATMPENGEPMIVIKGGSMKIGMRDGLAWLID